MSSDSDSPESPKADTLADRQYLAHQIEVFRKALMEAHADDWDMDLVAEAAHICARAALAAHDQQGDKGSRARRQPGSPQWWSDPEAQIDQLLDPVPADLVERADDDITRLLAQLVKAHPGKALRVLLETGALEQCGWQMRTGSFVSRRFGEAHGHEEMLAVYRLAGKESTRG